MSVRLTESMRDSILVQLMNHRFEKERKAIKNRENEIGLSIYRAAYDAKTSKQMNSLPEGWLPVTNSVRFSVSGYSHSVSLMDCVRVPMADHHRTILRLNGEDDRAVKYQQFRVDENALRKAEEECKAEAKRVLHQCSTVASLLKAWPEIKPFVDELELGEVDAKKLPAVIPADLNKKLALPVEGKK